MSVGNVREDKYMYGEYENKVFIKLVGNSTMKNSKTLEDIFAKILTGDKKDIVLDFTDSNYMDSTVLGTIAKNAVKVKKAWGESVYAVNVGGAIKMGLSSTGIDKIIKIIDSESVSSPEMMTVEKSDFADKRSKTEHILDAHKMLMTLNEENKKVFKNVVDLMEKELEK